MKIIHTADIHLGSKMNTRFTDKKIADERKKEIRNAFQRLVDFASKEEVSIIMLCGDIFDSNNPSSKDKDFFYTIIRNNKHIDFLYLKGNHDLEEESEDVPENLKLFKDTWISYKYGDVVISGIEIRDINAKSYYSNLELNKDDLNIVMLHGQVNDTSDLNYIDLKRLKNKNIDYLALGHIHKPSQNMLDDRCKYVYCGCLEGRGFDETGSHGFVLLDIKDGKVEDKFIEFAKRTIHECNINISSVKNYIEASEKIKDYVSFNDKDLYKINISGELDFNVDIDVKDIKDYLSNYCYYIDIKDKTVKKIDIAKYEKDISIKGEFVRTVYNNKKISEEDKVKIINIGLKALEGRDIDL